MIGSAKGNNQGKKASGFASGESGRLHAVKDAKEAASEGDGSRSVKNIVLKALAAVVVGVLAAILAFMFVLAVEGASPEAAIAGGLHAFVSRRFALILIACLVVSILLFFRMRVTVDILFRYRWLIACVLFATCVAMQLSGSSLGMMHAYFGGEDDPLFGVSRAIRSDEWSVFTPMSVSQTLADPAFSGVNDSFRGMATDMLIVYGQPAWDLATLFRPFFWGYLLFGSFDADFGLSFFWCGRLIFLFMVSLEFGLRILTNRSRPLSLAYALLITFSGLVQWWFSVNGLVEMLLFGQLAVIWGQLYLQTSSYKARMMYALGIAWCLGVFVLTFYPAWQVPFGFVFLSLLVWLLVTYLPRACKSWKDIPIIMGSLALLAASLTCVFIDSWDTVMSVMNTAYPGHRADTGGGEAMMFFEYPVSLFTSMEPIPGVCEYGSIFNAFPLCLFLPIYIMARRRRLSAIMVCLLVVAAILGLFAAVGFPEWLAKITMLSHSFGMRAANASMFALLMLLVISLGKLQRSDLKAVVIIAAVSLVIEIASMLAFDLGVRLAYYILMAAVVTVFFVGCACAPFKFGKRIFCASSLLVSLMCGMLVNPLATNVASNYQDIDSLEKIESLSDEGDLWATIGLNFPHANALAGLDLSTLTATNTYPQLDTWHILDPEGVYDDVYNRYAHVEIALKPEGEPVFVEKHSDAFMLECTVDDLDKLGVDKVLSAELPEGNLETESTDIEMLAQVSDNLYVYEIDAR